jgi:hypothetical protein
LGGPNARTPAPAPVPAFHAGPPPAPAFHAGLPPATRANVGRVNRDRHAYKVSALWSMSHDLKLTSCSGVWFWWRLAESQVW